MAATLRVHTLAKELNIDSKAIIAKCKAEGIELKNHMAAISVGLAESIREWFSATADITSVETAAPVDLDTVPKRKPRKSKRAGEHDDQPHDDGETVVEAPAEETETATVTVMAPPVPSAPPEIEISAPTFIEEPPAPPTEPVVIPFVAPTEPGVPVSPAATVAEPELELEPPADFGIVELVPPATPTRAPVPPAPPAPPAVPVGPAGPKLVPKPAILQGPRVVRIEAPEQIAKPRPRPAAMGPGYGSGDRSGPGSAPPGFRGPPRAGAGAGAAPASRTKAEEEREAARKTARSPRRHDRGEEFVERLKEWRDQDLLERKERLAHATGQGLRARRSAEARRQTASTPVTPGKRGDTEIVVPIMVRDFCSAVGAPYAMLSRKLLEQSGTLYRINDMLDQATVELIAADLGLSIQIERARTALETLEDEFSERERPNLQHRPPIVAMLGHVDHGKTSLLDAIRRTSVAKGEAGGITQRIGAYRIDRGEWHVTFLDTPGHQAFTAMRARGANLTDVVVLVVAADDGVMPQTVEAINHARAAGVQIVVALNKIDMPGVDVNKVYGQLAEQELVPSEWGGNIDVIKTSATKGEGVDELVAHLSTLSELMDLKADPDVPAFGVVIESHMQEGRGVVAQILVREGTLKVGQHVVCGGGSGRVRSLYDDCGKRVQSAGPATPVEVGGLNEMPQAGDKLYVVGDAAEAKEIAAEVSERRRMDALAAIRKPATLEDLLRGASEGELPELNVIIKADGQSRVDVLKAELSKMPQTKAKLRILHSGIGAISEADIELAKASRAIIFGFDVVPEDRAKAEADSTGVEIRVYRVIYELIDDMRKALEGLLEPEYKLEIRSKVEVRQVYNITRVGTVAGCNVLDGTIGRNHKVRLVRDSRIVVDSVGLASLKRFKDDVREVRAGMDCGIKIEGYDDVKPGDIIESFEMVEKRQSLE